MAQKESNRSRKVFDIIGEGVGLGSGGGGGESDYKDCFHSQKISFEFFGSLEKRRKFSIFMSCPYKIDNFINNNIKSLLPKNFVIYFVVKKHCY
jgi:hypothetical protein